ncbi:MAG: DUF421 domain-containing protein [Clostridia bacterium]|nr:DUF421 domain-containing protein [Clostridia bacterium]
MLVVIIRTLILYLTVIISLRIMGKRQVGELQPAELVVAIMISDLATVPMQTVDMPLFAGIIPVLTLMLAEVFISFIGFKCKFIRRVLSGDPSIVIYKGVINEKELERLRFSVSDLLEELRVNNCYNISDVEAAVLETSGKLSVIPKSGDTTGSGLPCVVISDGSFNKGEIKRAKLTEAEVIKQIKKFGASDVKKIFLASVDANGEFHIQLKKTRKQRSN